MKKTTKVLALLSSLLVLVMLMTACYPAGLVNEMTLNVDGSGTRKFTVFLLKDGVENPDDPDEIVSGMFTDPGYFPQGIQPAVDYLNGLRPDFLTELEVEEEDDNYLVTFYMDFDSIEDLNEKFDVLSLDWDWEDNGVDEAAITIEEEEDKTVYTYTEDASFANFGALWMSVGLWESDQGEDRIFDREYAQGETSWEGFYNDYSDESNLLSAMFFTYETVIDFEGVVESFGEKAEEVSVTYTVEKKKEPVEDDSPQTSDLPMAAGLVLMLSAAAALLTKKK